VDALDAVAELGAVAFGMGHFLSPSLQLYYTVRGYIMFMKKNGHDRCATGRRKTGP
jgi:hypothetical protein